MNLARQKKLILILLTVAITAGSLYWLFSRNAPVASAGWYDDSWLYRQIVTITNSGSAQTDFQTMITLDTAALYTAGKIQIDCDDIRITDHNGKLLPHWIEPTTCNTSTTKIWTKVSSISTTGATLYIYYGNSQVASASSATDTFVREILGVQGAWNMNEASWNGTAGEVIDASGAGNNGVAGGATHKPTTGTGKFGNGGVFDGTDDYVATPSFSLTSADNTLTFGAWVNTASEGSVVRAFLGDNGQDISPGFIFLYKYGNDIAWQYADGTSNRELYLSNYFSGYTDTWIHMTVVIDYNNKWAKFYRNGDLISTVTTNYPMLYPDTNRIKYIGAYRNASGYPLNGSIDDVRIYNRALSQSEITDLYGTGGDRQGYATTNYPNKVLVRKYSDSVSVGSPSGEERGPGPVAYWKFDEGFGQTANDSAFSNNGTLGATSGAEASDPTWQTEDMCVTGKCLKFDGTDDYINAGNDISLDLTSQFTIEAWINPASEQVNYNSIVHKGSFRYYLGLDANRLVELWVNNTNTLKTDSAVPGNKWSHIAWTHSDSPDEDKIFIDGILAKTGNLPDPVSDAASGLGVGNSLAGVNHYLGFMDDVKIYPYARTAAQIKTDYASRGSSNGSSVVIASEAKQSLSNGLVGYWKMDEASWTNDCSASSVLDASGAGNNGKACPASTGPVGGAAGKFGNGGSFDGSNDYVNLGSSATLNPSSFTYSAWIKKNTSSTIEYYILNNGTSRVLGVRNNKIIFGTESSEQYVSTTSVAINTWYHVTVTYDGTNGKLFVDGVLESSSQNSIGIGSGSLIIGRCGHNNADYWSGSLNEIRVYNRALSPKEVRDLYNFAPGPVGWWKMDDSSKGAGQTKADSSGYNNNGTTYSANGTGMNCDVQGKNGKGCQFDGVDDSVASLDSNSLDVMNDKVTLEAWIFMRTLNTSNKSGIVGKWRNYGMAIRENGSLVYNQTGWTSSNGTVPLNRWIHAAVTYDGADTGKEVKFYMDGILDSSSSWYQAMGPNSSDLTIGLSNWSDTYFDGSIDDVRVYNYVRTQKQIVEDMSARGGSAVGGLAGSGNSALGYWKFDEGYGITANNSGFGGSALNGTLTGMASPAIATSGWTNSGKFGKGLQFDGTDDVATITNAAAIDLNDNLNTGFTISGWINADTAGEGSGGQIFWKGANSYLRVDNLSGGRLDVEGKLDLATTDASLNVASAIATGAWNHIAMIYDGAAKITIWINGVNKGSNTGSGASAVDSNNLLIGGTTTDNFDGAIDEFKVYSYALTEDEIKLDYNQGAATKLGSTSTASDGITADNSANRSYCIPGDTSTCNPPIAEWNFDEKTGQSANDISGNANIGTLGATGGADVTDPAWISGRNGGALRFDGSDDYASFGTGPSLNGTTDFSVQLWMKTTNDGVANGKDGMTLIAQRDSAYNGEYVINIGKNYDGADAHAGKLMFVVYNAGFQFEFWSNARVDDGKWHFLNFTRSGADGYIYIDGKLDNSATGPIKSLVSTLTTNIGKDVNWNMRFFDGSMDEVRIYNYARTPAQIAWDYNRGKPIAEWKFDECQGNIANDASGNGNNGTITIGATVPQDGLGTCTDGDTSNAWYNGRNGKINSAMSFDGVDDYVNTADTAFDYTSNFSISAWVYPKNVNSTAQSMVAKQEGNSYGLLMQNTNKAEFIAHDGAAYRRGISDSVLANNTWYHLVGVVSGAEVSIYVNGVKQATTGTLTNYITTNNYNLTIGANPGATYNEYFNGLIDDVKIFNYALTPLQVKTEYNQGAVNFR